MHKNQCFKVPSWFNYLFSMFSISILMLFLYTSWVFNTGAVTSGAVIDSHLVLDKYSKALKDSDSESVSSDG